MCTDSMWWKVQVLHVKLINETKDAATHSLSVLTLAISRKHFWDTWCLDLSWISLISVRHCIRSTVLMKPKPRTLEKEDILEIRV